VRLEQQSILVADGLRLPYVAQGDPAGIPVVLLHAYVDSWRSFEPVLAHLPHSIRALVPTQRGHGDADKPTFGYALEQMAADAAAFLHAVELDAAVIVGSSSGGYVAQRFAVDFPQLTRALVLIGSPRSLRDKPAILDAVFALEDPVDRAFVREFVAATASRSVPPQFLDAMCDESCKVPAHVWKAALRGLTEAMPPSEGGAIGVPTLIVWGDQDQFLSRGDQERLAASIPRSRFVVYEGVGHIVHWEQPERVAVDIVAFVENLPR